MALNPIHLSRVSFNGQTGALLEAFRRSSLSLFTQQNRLSSGRTFATPSEDPARAAEVLDLAGGMGIQEQILENIRHATDLLDATDGVVSEVHSLLTDAQSIASQNAGSLTSADERTAAAELIGEIVDHLVSVGNRQFNGRYLFAGRATQDPPFASVLGGVAFLGDTGDILAQVSELDEEPINLTGDALFGALGTSVVGNVDLTPRLTLDTRLDEIVDSLGGRLELGTLVISAEGSADRVLIDLTSADTLGDLIDLINEGAGGLVEATLEDGILTLTPGSRRVRISDTGSGTFAGRLGVLAGDFTDGAIGDGGLRRLITRTTPVVELADGTGVDLSGGITIRNGNQTATLDLSSAETVQDVLNAINAAGLYVRAQITADGRGLEVVNLVSGTRLSLAEAEGTTAAELGLRTMDERTPLSLLNGGKGIETVEGLPDLRITAKNGSTVDVDLDGLTTVQEVIDAINTAAADAGVAVTASLAPNASALRIEDATGGTGSLSVTRLNLSYAVDDLGLDKTVTGDATELVGDEIGVVRADGVLTALLDLEAGLRANDDRAITDAAGRLDGFIETVTRANGVVGARAKAMRDRQEQTDAAVGATQELLSRLEDLDYAEAVTKFQQAQVALQATLLTGSRSLNVSLLDFLA